MTAIPWSAFSNVVALFLVLPNARTLYTTDARTYVPRDLVRF